MPAVTSTLRDHRFHKNGEVVVLRPSWPQSRHYVTFYLLLLHLSRAGSLIFFIWSLGLAASALRVVAAAAYTFPGVASWEQSCDTGNIMSRILRCSSFFLGGRKTFHQLHLAGCLHFGREFTKFPNSLVILSQSAPPPFQFGEARQGLIAFSRTVRINSTSELGSVSSEWRHHNSCPEFFSTNRHLPLWWYFT
jgi:hypothetical protein